MQAGCTLSATWSSYGHSVRRSKTPWASCRYLVFYLAGGMVAMLAQVLGSPYSRIPSLGASGAIAAVMGAFIVTYPRDRIRTLLFIFIFFRVTYIPAVLLIGFWFLTSGSSASDRWRGCRPAAWPIWRTSADSSSAWSPQGLSKTRGESRIAAALNSLAMRTRIHLRAAGCAILRAHFARRMRNHKSLLTTWLLTRWSSSGNQFLRGLAAEADAVGDADAVIGVAGQAQAGQRRNAVGRCAAMRSWWPTAYCAMARRQRVTWVCSGSTPRRGPCARRISPSSRRTMAISSASGSARRVSFFMPPRNARKTAFPGGVRPRNLRCTKVQASMARPSLAGNEESEAIGQRADSRLVVDEIDGDRGRVGDCGELVAQLRVHLAEQHAGSPRRRGNQDHGVEESADCDPRRSPRASHRAVFGSALTGAVKSMMQDRGGQRGHPPTAASRRAA